MGCTTSHVPLLTVIPTGVLLLLELTSAHAIICNGAVLFQVRLGNRNCPVPSICEQLRAISHRNFRTLRRIPHEGLDAKFEYLDSN